MVKALPVDRFKAVQDQLGLKLEATKQTYEMLVIDRIERPDESEPIC